MEKLSGAARVSFRLVAAAVLLLAQPVWSQGLDRQAQREGAPPAAVQAAREGTPQGQAAAALELRGWPEVRRAGCDRFYRKPRSLLYFLPGPVILLIFLFVGAPARPLAALLAVLLLGAGGDGAELLTRQAEAAYRQGSYREAAEGYLAAQELTGCNPALSVDLALSHRALGEAGYAVGYLRRAVAALPGDLSLRRTLESWEEGYGLASQVPPPPAVNPDLPFFLLVGMVNLTSLVGAALVRLRRVRLLIVVVLLAVATVGCLAAFLGVISRQGREVAVVAQAGTDLLKIPEQDSGTWLELPPGTALLIRGRSGRYALVETGLRLRGWVPLDRLLLD